LKHERYAEVLGEFETMLRLGTELSNRLVGTMPTEKHLSYADSIYTKLLCHAVSLHKLSPQIENKPEHELWDVPSACAIARCIIEAHDVLGYVVFSEASPEERDFRLLIWRLHDQQRRSKMLNSIESQDPRAEEIHTRARALSDETLNHPWFSRVAKHLQNKIKSGDAPSFLLSQRELNKANSVNQEYHTSATMWLSQYVHTFPMSVHQLSEFRAGTAEALHISSMPIQYTLGFLAATITKMAETFPVVNMELTELDSALFSRWRSVVEYGVTTASWQSQ
jgi:hypothetical protein